MIRRVVRQAAAVGLVVAASAGWLCAGTAGAAPSANPPGPGTYVVGTDIAAGVYTSAGPLPGDACYWRRVGPGNTTLDNALSKQTQTVQIDPSDTAFTTRGCQPWQRADGLAVPTPNPPWQSQLELRHLMDILNGLAGQLPPDAQPGSGRG